MGIVGVATTTGISGCGNSSIAPVTPTEIIITPDVSGGVDVTIGVAGSFEFDVKDNLGKALNNPTVTISNITPNTAVIEGIISPISGTVYQLE
jgi:hypothetical protein